ncbi:hypothetical protein CANARDRAFT_180041, partial [[Candida] arabinofermentans NRRL YB-2248]
SIEYMNQTIILEPKNYKHSLKLKFQILTSFLSLFILGLIDQSIGSIMQYLLADYQINRIQISYLFLFQFIGYIISSFANNQLSLKFGIAGVYSYALLMNGIYCFLFSLRSPFVILILTSIFNGFGVGSLDCSLNLYIGNLNYSNQILGMMHSFYGLGCFVSPVFVIYLIHQGMLWNYYFLIIGSLITINFILVLILFKNETPAKFQYVMSSMNDGDDDEDTSVLNILKNKSVQFFATSLFLYIGSELSLGVWLFNYILKIKSLDEKKASYITSTYWLFMTIGRFSLAFVTGHYFEDNETYAMVIYTGLVASGCFSFMIFNQFLWIQIISICIIGYCVGPVFSTTVVISIKNLPKHLSTAGVSIICGIGATGAAVVPYIMGVISEKFGTDGGGLVYFPLVIFISFSGSFLMW